MGYTYGAKVAALLAANTLGETIQGRTRSTSRFVIGRWSTGCETSAALELLRMPSRRSDAALWDLKAKLWARPRGAPGQSARNRADLRQRRLHLL